MSQTWGEVYWGSSGDAERKHFDKLARDILKVQERVQRRSGAGDIDRAFHAKPILATKTAKFQFAKSIPKEFRVKFASPGRIYPAAVRISNASGAHQSDEKRDLRGIAVRVTVSDEECHDLLMTNFPIPHARDANQFVAFALAMSGSRLLAIPRLVWSVGPFEAVRMLRNVIKGSKRPVKSVALETYWSRGAILWGAAGPVRYFLRAEDDAEATESHEKGDTDYLRREIGERLLHGDVVYEFCVQRYINERITPIENAAKEWQESDSPPVVIARLIVPKQNMFTAEAEETGRVIDALSFNPWHTTDDFRPLGNINRARKTVYQSSAAHRQKRCLR